MDRKSPYPDARRLPAPVDSGFFQNQLARKSSVHCPYNPFAPGNYEALREIDDKAGNAAVERSMRDPLIGPKIAQLFSHPGPGVDLTGPAEWTLYHTVAGDGSSFLERWQADGFKGLRNDEVTVLTARSRIRVELVEILEVRDDLLVLGRNLLQPDRPPALYADHTLAARACRFDRFLALAYRSRTSSVCSTSTRPCPKSRRWTRSRPSRSPPSISAARSSRNGSSPISPIFSIA